MTIDMNMNNRLELGKLICFSYVFFFFLLICRFYLYHARSFCFTQFCTGFRAFGLFYGFLSILLLRLSCVEVMSVFDVFLTVGVSFSIEHFLRYTINIFFLGLLFLFNTAMDATGRVHF